LLFNKSGVVELVLVMERIVNRLVFILGGMRITMEEWLVLVLQKWQEQDPMRR
jgi:hypothetical protein